ncbi:MerR family transcriptional regulator [Nonomuraea ceibae]|uniref:MerR family transcriptional regulator n=1 Tax=Nonomuraea ceibae TaxID=1935170 RepID=UPI001C5DBE10|nr:MerR family transcriptional regulator [Nonomuraea ceibae]
MDGTLYSIGDLARRTGLTVKTIRFYSDQGIVPPADRGPTGYRRYDAAAVARLDLVRTLRELGVGLATIRRVVDREVTLAEVAAAHAEALSVQIRTLRQRRAVLTAVARRGSTPEEMDLMHKLARLSEEERRELIGGFLDAVFDGLVVDGLELDGPRRSMTPELPDDPTAEQVEAWVRLAELSRDPDFRASMRRLAEDHRDDGLGLRPGPVEAARARAGAPPSAADVAAVAGEYARALGVPDDAALRRRLLSRLEAAADPRRELYLGLLAVINGWPAPEPLAPALTPFVEALRGRPGP